ncbi:DEAD/DEAH box helicase [[Clostridium] fimetarium]|uniref:Superfamily I DNA and/or RNA helicase n=1 Tax=[Clostridium] fimetarium TaxID=99656 RepID=A0A1I0MA02_9FIRM|nr:DEAD/DEAH box helicase [[Clostridium] fimetarium]SEV85297.1 Superfamily I DNA and/or RNA helicase [[Clostridium] fimetarium]
MNSKIVRGDSKQQWLNKQESASIITEFWHTIEFLNQPVFPRESRENRKKVKKEEENLRLQNKFKPYNTFSVFHKLTEDCKINHFISEDDNKFVRNPEKGKECYVCIGQLERSELVKKLDELLEIHVEEIEKDYSKLACFGLKIEGSGSYITESFNISPLLWGIKIVQQYGNQAQKEITTKRYKDDLEKYEKILQKESTLTNEVLKSIYKEINNDYVMPLLIKESVYEGIFVYNRYLDQKTFEKLDNKSEDLSDLSHGFFTEDLLMVKESVQTNAYGNNSKMQKAVINYITSVCEEEKSTLHSMSRLDIKNNKEDIKRCLKPENLPMGKWPSKYVPALMQQVAINIQISQEKYLRPIFSINGPPGTGKTTLLKEIISNNIVERAILLAKYNTPDDAFIECSFSDGKLRNNGYDKFYYRYYKFKDNELANYGMLVTSCNNNAVENITKDLPNGSDLCDSLKGDKKTDTEQKIHGLMEIENLFSLEKTNKIESYKIKKRISDQKYITETVELPDIYFSWLAHRLLSEDEYQEKEFKEWGMISAPLGKRSNINNYCYHVLNPLIDDFLKLNDKRQERLSEFRKYVEEFENQLEKVTQQEKELILYSELEDTYRTKVEEFEKVKKAKELQIFQQKEILNQLIKNKHSNEVTLKNAECEYQVIKSQVIIEEKKIDELKIEIESCKNSKEEVSNKIVSMEDALKLFDRICILLNKETERISRIKEKKAEKEEIANRENLLKDLAEQELDYLEDLNKKYEDQNKFISKINNAIDNITKEIETQEKTCERYQVEILIFENKKVELQKQFCEQINKVKEKVDVLDSLFWSDFDSKDNDRSTNAQLVNPWVSDEFNRSREKLFFLALQVHKEFVLSSTSCRDNFINLAMMWQTRNNSDDDLVIYSKKDREKAFPELLNTLFLFTPVISTTFASVQTFLSDIKEPERIGLLIVDEAGQAPPQMAAGALYRSKKAIIVGDPKQVEPVVTDDADHIKRAFSDEIVRPYISKTISVQEFADRINNYGTYIKNLEGNDQGTWVGCPLIVHRRCINPMFNISNAISYGNSMKIKTNNPKDELCKKFLYDKSQWFDVKGKERDTKGKNHFVELQGKLVCQMLSESFQLYSGKPDIFVISPFASVVDGIIDMLNSYPGMENYKDELEDWCNENCGTVHKFQGKEAAEVIFLLGCDENSLGAVKWVKSNIVNVAVTRAKYRLYVIGDYTVWNKSRYVRLLSEYL